MCIHDLAQVRLYERDITRWYGNGKELNTDQRKMAISNVVYLNELLELFGAPPSKLDFNPPKAKAPKQPKINPLSVIIVRQVPTGKFKEAYFADASDPQDVANVIRNLKAWHPKGHKRIDLSKINERRSQMGLYALLERDLPAPTGVAPPSEPLDVSVAALADAHTRTAERVGARA